MNPFPYPPTPQTLQWLAAGQLANRFLRSLRLWVILNQLYRENGTAYLPQPFTYSQLRDGVLFSPFHPTSEKLNRDEIIANCHDETCLCHRTGQDIIFTQNQLARSQWVAEVGRMTGLTDSQIEQLLEQRPFATVHRSLRDDLKQLVSLGWLESSGQGKYKYLHPYPHEDGTDGVAKPFPTPPNTAVVQDHSYRVSSQSSISQLNISQSWELLQVLESVAFIQPNLSLIINSLWEQISQVSSTSPLLGNEPQQRIFLHIDYIISPTTQDRIDNYQEQLENLWQKPPGGVIKFAYWIASQKRQVTVIVYPVCLHYLRRAKYLSAYGIDPEGKTAWHNYRLDRVAWQRLKILPWGDREIPADLKQMWQNGELPTPEYISRELAAAWGFNFYLPKELLIMRFPGEFAQWYVDNTFRHQTFRSVYYQELPQIVNKYIQNSREQKQILAILQQRSPEDSYYTAWIRTGDINVLMRLRDWRPKGEAIAPLSIRAQLAQEAAQELANYGEFRKNT